MSALSGVQDGSRAQPAQENKASPASSTQNIAAQVNQVWAGSVNIQAPDQRWIPVDNPTRIRYESGSDMSDSYWVYDSSPRIVLDDGQNLSCTYAKRDERTYRAVEGFDYSSYGLTKIGEVWVNAKNQKAIDNANKLAVWQASWCVIL